MTDKPAHQKPELADFWDHRFRNGVTPWEMGRVPSALQDFVVHGVVQAHCAATVRSPRVLIPGCGSAWDAAFMARQGWRVTALDFSPLAIEIAATTLGEEWRGTLLCADFFTFDATETFDVIYERAFLCALPRHLWPRYAERMAVLLRKGGLLVGYFFLGDTVTGPPFAILPGQLDALLGAHFVRQEDGPVDDSLPIFAGRERWQIWQKR